MKMTKIAAACALAFAGQAFAVTPATTPDVQLFISGSSALQNAIGQVALDMCATGTIDELFDGTAAAASGSNYRGYFCTFKTGTTTSGITIPATLGGKNVLVYNTAAGGSIKGVNNVALSQAVNRLDIATCVFPTTTKSDGVTGVTAVYSCTGTVTTAVPDAGVADTEPAMFTGINLAINASTALTTRTTVGAALTATQRGALTTVYALGQPMGIVATSNINASTGALVLGRAQIASLMAGSIADWNTVVPSVAAGTTSVVICRRQPGSGTQVTWNNILFGFPCATSQLAPADATSNTATLGSSTPVAAGNLVIIENSSSGVMAGCLDYAQAGQTGAFVGKAIDVTTGAIVTAGTANSVVLPTGTPAIGIMGFDHPPVASDTFNYVAVDGATPTLAAAAAGQYPFIVESTFNRRTSAAPVLSQAQIDLFNTFASSTGNPKTLGTAGHVVPGVAALTENFYSTFDTATTVGGNPTGAFQASYPVIRAGNNGNTCTPVTQLQ